jgi:hypothetical protein
MREDYKIIDGELYISSDKLPNRNGTGELRIILWLCDSGSLYFEWIPDDYSKSNNWKTFGWWLYKDGDKSIQEVIDIIENWSKGVSDEYCLESDL